MHWSNERQIPKELLDLLDNPETPKQLWVLIAKAHDEVENYGAVTYPTKANIETFYLNAIKKEAESDSGQSET
jgi:hypothetical protein